MDRTRILVVRHGEHDDGGLFSQHACRGLTQEGRRQAAALAAELADSDVDVVLASQAARAIQTAQIVAGTLNRPVLEQTCDLCEMHPGEAEGLTYPQMVERYGPTYAEVPGAEYFPDWLPRGIAGLRRIAEDYRSKSVACFTHGGVVAASFKAFGHMPHRETETIRAGNTAVTEWVCSLGETDPRRGVWQLRRHNDTAHLRASR